MKIQFSADLEYQKEAVAAIVDIFKGQENCRTNFTVAPLQAGAQSQLSFMEESNLGVGNRLRLLPEDILTNVRAVQLRNGLAPSDKLNGMHFTVEMETGTGKTYVYLRTIFKLNREYGFTKFIIVVPSIAIKEGVHKSLQITQEHFRGLYDNVQFDFFLYDSENLGQVRNFATSDYIQIMVINIDAFRKSFDDPEKEAKANIIHRPHDRMTGARPIEFIQATHPIVIIDEPQSVDSTAKSKQAVASLSPLCTLRYSATHVDKYNMMYKLDSVDAYEQKLVKQIEVASIQVQDSHNKAYIKLLKVENKQNRITAQVEFDVRQPNGEVKRTTKTVGPGDDLYELSGNRDMYQGYIIEEINCRKGKEYITFTSRGDMVGLNQVIGDVNDDDYKRLQIQKTIQKHLEKEMALRPKGLKVLSLFFIDRVANYRTYDQDGNPQPGKYAQMFEKEYRKAIQNPTYRSLFGGADLETAADGVHDGYFAVDKKKDAKGNEMLKDSRGEGTSQADESAYELIMRDKERLLSFDSKLKFIFSHSALKEGWDNPNVFQICTLNETNSVMKKRQQIGRGLRIAVNQDGERVYGFEVNRLTVIANQSFESFARELQTEIEEETGIKFGVVEHHLFANIPVPTVGQQTTYLGVDTSQRVWEHLKAKGYIDAQGRVQDALRKDLKDGNVDLPVAVADQAAQITAVLRKVAGNLNIKNADERRQVMLNKQVFLGDEFRQLWDRIKFRTTFRVEFDPEQLINVCAQEIQSQLSVGRARFITQTVQLKIDRGGVQTSEAHESAAFYDAHDFVLPDIVTYLQNDTNLTRRTVVEILRRSGRLHDFKKNPQKFIEQVSQIIKRRMRLFIVDGIKYTKIGDEHYYAQELFDENELYGYLSKNMLASKKSVYDHVVYDSDVEEAFARKFEASDDVKVYAKLPGWFKIDTPLGSYNPDWAVVVEVDGREQLYFVVETKGNTFLDAVRETERAKIFCGRKHFEELGNEAKFTVASTYEDFLEKMSE